MSKLTQKRFARIAKGKGLSYHIKHGTIELLSGRSYYTVVFDKLPNVRCEVAVSRYNSFKQKCGGKE